MADAHDVPAFDAIFRSEVRYVGRTLRYLGVREGQLEDACQEVFIIVHRKLDDLKEHSSLRTWVRRICVFVAANQRRTHRRRREEMPSEPPEGVAPPNQPGDLEAQRMRSLLLDVLDELPREQREVFVLYEVEELTMREVAEALSCPLQTAYSRLHAARARVRSRIGK